MINALITKENRPKVKIVMGNDKIERIGFTIRLSIPKTMAKITADIKPSNCTPERILLRIKADIAVISKRIMKFIVDNFNDLFSHSKTRPN